MPRKKKIARSRDSFNSLAKSVSLLRSDVKRGREELRAQLNDLGGEMHAAFEQLSHHIDRFVKLHETLDVDLKRLREQMQRLKEKVERLESS